MSAPDIDFVTAPPRMAWLHRFVRLLGWKCPFCEWNKLQVCHMHEAIGMAQKDFARLDRECQKVKTELDALKKAIRERANDQAHAMSAAPTAIVSPEPSTRHSLRTTRTSGSSLVSVNPTKPPATTCHKN